MRCRRDRFHLMSNPFRIPTDDEIFERSSAGKQAKEKADLRTAKHPAATFEKTFLSKE
jgi:hypothetical protein